MSQWTIGKKIAGGILAVLIQALCVGCFALWISARRSSKLDLVSSQYLPVTELASQVEREFLNARIHFIYFVTIQKKGSLEKGWERFRNAQKELPELQRLVGRSDVLAGLRPDVEKLRRTA